ncbi:hypothetical protein N8482_01330 [Chitinophagales bacterium]|nr:hypothetical protein [Chitinophagales bacterium]
MAGYTDIYIIRKTRSKRTALEFLDHYLPQRKESADCYEFPRFGKTTDFELATADEVMSYMENNHEEEHCIYYHNLDLNSINRHANLFYTPDGFTIYGVSVPASDLLDSDVEKNALLEMKTFFQTDEGYMTYECPPERTGSEFLKLVTLINQREANPTNNFRETLLKLKSSLLSIFKNT